MWYLSCARWVFVLILCGTLVGFGYALKVFSGIRLVWYHWATVSRGVETVSNEPSPQPLV